VKEDIKPKEFTKDE
jgi:DNA replication initiation complex subunit (GINS family)